MLKEEVAKVLGVSVRAVERLVDKGELHPRNERKEGGGVRGVYDPAEVEQYRKRREAEQTGAVRRIESTPTAADLAKAALAATHTMAQAIERREAAHTALPGGVSESVPITSKLMLTIEEAAAYSGLGIGQLEAAIEAGKLKAPRLGPHGARVVKREAVEAYVKKL